MLTKPPGIDDLSELVHLLNAAMEHVPPHTRAFLERNANARVKGIEDALCPPADKNQDHG